MVEHIRAFLEAMHAAGIRPAFRRGEDIIDDGVIHRFHVEGDSRGSLNGWYVLHRDGTPAGEFGSWKTNAKHKWCMKDRALLTPEENRVIEERFALAKAQREREKRVREGEAAKLANLLWSEAEPIFGDAHPYLQRKQVRSHGLRVTEWPLRGEDGEPYDYVENTLLIPIYNTNGKIISLQAIFPERPRGRGRDKDFMRGGKKGGGFYLIGNPPAKHGDHVVFCEGYATGATIHEATGYFVVVCFDAGNIPKVAEALREQFNEASFIIAADNDQWTKPTPENPNIIDNPGITFGKRAAAATGARVVWPEFESLDGEPTDFNDLHVREGISKVQVTILPSTPLPAKTAEKASAGALTVPGCYMGPIDFEAIDRNTPFPEIDGKTRPVHTTDNVAHMLRRLGVTVRYNVIAKKIEYNIPGLVSTVDNRANVGFTILQDWCVRFRMPTERLGDSLITVADANPVNPVADWIESRPWDGVSRLEDFYATVRETEPRTMLDGRSLKKLLIRKWLLSAVAAVYEPNGVVARGVLVFKSEQNIGKTYWAKRLAPPELEVVKDGLILDTTDRDSVKECVSNWIVELGELDATFRKSDIAALKAFVSKQRDELRLPYAREASCFPRRTIFFASVNEEKFLRDPTGNTRWWVIDVASLDNKHSIDVQQLWAEMLDVYRGGESWHLTPEELSELNASNTEHQEINPVHDMIDRAFAWGSPRDTWTRQFSATEITLACGIDRPTRNDVNTAASYVVKRYGVVKTKKGKDRNTVWLMPAKPSAMSTDDEPF